MRKIQKKDFIARKKEPEQKIRKEKPQYSSLKFKNLLVGVISMFISTYQTKEFIPQYVFFPPYDHFRTQDKTKVMDKPFYFVSDHPSFLLKRTVAPKLEPLVAICFICPMKSS